MNAAVTRRDVLDRRVRAQQLDRLAGTGTLEDTNLLDSGVQDTGPDGALWALAVRGVDVSTLSPDDLVMLWTIRGAPHVYRRADVRGLATAVAPFSEEDAGKRIFDATKPLKAAGIANLEALDAVAAAMREVVTSPMSKGEVSTKVSAMMSEPYLRWCRACDATHLYEMPFRLAAFRAGLELQPGTSPPVLQRIGGFDPAALSYGEAPARLDVVRGYLRLLGPATTKHVADYLDAPVKDVKDRWPSDTVEVDLDGQPRWMLVDDAPAVGDAAVAATRLLGPYDLYLQGKDRKLLVSDPAHAKALWPVLGRPGAVLVDGEIAGTWRPRQSGAKLNLQVELWGGAPREAVEEQAERLAAFRRVRLGTVTIG